MTGKSKRMLTRVKEKRERRGGGEERKTGGDRRRERKGEVTGKG